MLPYLCYLIIKTERKNEIWTNNYCSPISCNSNRNIGNRFEKCSNKSRNRLLITNLFLGIVTVRIPQSLSASLVSSALALIV
jgi:hypothetical protein